MKHQITTLKRLSTFFLGLCILGILGAFITALAISSNIRYIDESYTLGLMGVLQGSVAYVFFTSLIEISFIPCILSYGFYVVANVVYKCFNKDEEVSVSNCNKKSFQEIRAEVGNNINSEQLLGGFFIQDTSGLKLLSDPISVRFEDKLYQLVIGLKGSKLWIGIFDQSKHKKIIWQGQDDFDAYRECCVDAGITSNLQISWFDIKYCNIVDEQNMQVVTYSYTGVSSTITPGVFDLFFVCDGKLKVIAGNRGIAKRNITQDIKFEKYGDNGVKGWTTTMEAFANDPSGVVYYDKSGKIITAKEVHCKKDYNNLIKYLD